MITDIEKFAAAERPHWIALEKLLDRLEKDSSARLDLGDIQRLQYLYERACAGLAGIQTFSAERELRRHLEALVARAYGEIHEVRRRGARFRIFEWFFGTLPLVFRRRIRAFGVSVAATLLGCVFGAAAVAIDPEAKAVILPFAHLMGDPAERVRKEESTTEDHLSGAKSAFSAMLMTHNTRVSIFALAMGMTWGVGTLVTLFYNGVILGAVALDYMRAGQTTFLLGWLLPHGAVEIPAIVIAGQAGLVLAGAIIGRGARARLGERLRAVSPDVVTLIGGVAILLVWAGIVEAFFSQYHEPALPYTLKIGFGMIELVLLAFFLARAGRKQEASGE